LASILTPAYESDCYAIKNTNPIEFEYNTQKVQKQKECAKLSI